MQNKVCHEQHSSQENEQKYQVHYGELRQKVMLRGDGLVFLGRKISSDMATITRISVGTTIQKY